MVEHPFADSDFRKSGGSGDTGCVEVATGNGVIGVRDSKDQAGPVLVFNEHEWRVFVAGIKNGEFDV
jgi:hypothetical protein